MVHGDHTKKNVKSKVGLSQVCYLGKPIPLSQTNKQTNKQTDTHTHTHKANMKQNARNHYFADLHPPNVMPMQWYVSP